MQVVDKIDRLYKYKDECKISNLAVKRSLEVYHLLDGDCNMFPLESYKGHVITVDRVYDDFIDGSE